uniref:Cytochrome c oxidase subunit 2 n=1 Tax=Mordellidae sp. 4 ACP-2013 TaxID=1434549 RepID=A0A3G3MET4_9CUCU|nr:cytochrome c oxidase subunit 2 [Mordellidae sp. 4 ACP-2013]
MASWESLSLQDSSSPLMEQLSLFHDQTLLILAMITMLVGTIMSNLMTNKYIHRFLLEGQLIELIWTILPAVTLIFIALPSLKLIYIIDEMSNPLITIKTIGHQWFWSYEYSDFKLMEFDSFILPPAEMGWFNFRLLDTDYQMILPFLTPIRLTTTSADVIHSWTVPSLGIKMDATPGRLNQSSLFSNRTGIFFGQCSEICGANHSFMPISLETTSMPSFIKWLSKN